MWKIFTLLRKGNIKKMKSYFYVQPRKFNSKFDLIMAENTKEEKEVNAFAKTVNAFAKKITVKGMQKQIQEEKWRQNCNSVSACRIHDFYPWKKVKRMLNF